VTGAPPLRERSTEEAAAISMTVEEILQVGEEVAAAGRLRGTGLVPDRALWASGV
jgi:hypothetical protein